MRGSFVLRVFQTHVQPSDADSSVHLAEQRKGTETVDTGPKDHLEFSMQTSAIEIQVWSALIGDTYSSCWFLHAQIIVSQLFSKLFSGL